MFPRVERQVDLERIDARPIEGGCVYVIFRVRHSPPAPAHGSPGRTANRRGAP
jgi:hypothetical protein